MTGSVSSYVGDKDLNQSESFNEKKAWDLYKRKDQEQRIKEVEKFIFIAEPILPYFKTPNDPNNLLASHSLKDLPSLLAWKNDKGVTSLHLSTQNIDYLAIFKLLYEKTASPTEQKDFLDRTLYHYAAQNNNLEAFQFLQKSDPDFAVNVLQKDKTGKTPFHYAVIYGNLDIVYYLHEVLPDLLNQTDNEENTPLHYAAENGNLEIIKYLLEKKPSLLFQKNKNNIIVLAYAANSKNVEIIKYFLQEIKKLNPVYNLDDFNMFVSLNCAARNNDLNTILYLLRELQKPLTSLNKDKITFMHVAAKYGSMKVVEFFHPSLSYQATFNGRTPFLYSCAGGSIEAINFFYKFDPLVLKHLDKGFNNALHLAVIGGKTHAVEYLLTLDPSLINQTNRFEQTALHLAVKNADIAMVKHLLAISPGLLNKKDYVSKTAIDRKMTRRMLPSLDVE